MPTNLLVNSDFQAPYSFPSQGNEDVQRITATGTEMIRVPNIRVPTGWFCYTYDDGEFTQIEMQLGETQERLFEGHTSVKWFSRSRHNSGLYQIVRLQPGRYEFRAWAHCWNWHNIPGTQAGGPYDDVKGGLCSIGVENPGMGLGKGPYFKTGTSSDITTGDPWKDGPLNMTLGLCVAIGADPFYSEDMPVIGQGAHIYNVFHEIPGLQFDIYTETEVACSIACVTRWHYVNADMYLGKASLVRVSDVPGVPPVSGGLPRIQYTRVVNVVPEGAGVARALDVLSYVWPQTVTNSYDDAGLGALDDKTAVLWDIPAEARGEFEDFYLTYYPGTVVEFEGDTEPPVVPPSGEFLLWQRNPLWAAEKLAGRYCTSTIGGDGCWVTCCAMAQRFLGIDRAATPSTANKLLGPDGFSGCNTLWSAMMERLSLECVLRTRDVAKTIEWVSQDGAVVFIRVYLNGEHWVLAYDYDDVVGDYCVADPWKNITGYLEDLYPAGPWENGETPPFRLIREGSLTPLPPPPPPVVAPRNLISFQQQQARDYRDEFIRAVQPPVWLLIGGFEEAAHLKSLAPNMKIALRHVDNAWGQYLWADDKAKAAETWVRHYGDTLFNMADSIDYILGLNEYIATNDYPALEATPFWVEALVNRMEQVGWPARLICLNPGVGNPQTNAICDAQGIKRQVPILTPAARLLTDAQCLVGYHSYWGARNLGGGKYYSTLDDGRDYWYSMRALLDWDPVFTAAGVYPHYAFTEGGPIYVNPEGAMVSSGAGWRYSATYNGDVQAAIASVLKFNAMGNAWNATHGDRLDWLAMFLHGGFSDWTWFDWRGEPSRLLGEALRAL